MFNLLKEGRAVLLVDADNMSSYKGMELILEQLLSVDRIIIRRAYGDWFAPQLKGWQSILTEYEIEPIHSLPTPNSGKNATDIKLVIDAMDLLYSQSIDCFFIVTSDRDFTPLVRRLKQADKKVIGFGRKSSASILQNAYNEFIPVEDLVVSQVSVTSPENLSVISTNIATNKVSNYKATGAKPLRKELVEITQTAYEIIANNHSWITIGQLEPQLKKVCQHKLKQIFSCRLFGCKSLVKLINEAGIFEWDVKQPASTKTKNRKIRLKQVAI